MSDPITTTIDADRTIGRITLERPPVNSINADVVNALQDAIEELRLADEVEIIVVESDARAFSAGGDLEWYAAQSPNRMKLFNIKLHETLLMLENTPKPVIAAIDGACMAGGLELALACDLRYASSEATFGQVETAIGAVPGGGGTQRLPRVVGNAEAMELILTAEEFDAERAADLGLVNEVFLADRFEEAFEERVTHLADTAVEAHGLSKMAVKRGANVGISEGLTLEWALEGQVFDTDAYQKAISQYAEEQE